LQAPLRQVAGAVHAVPHAPQLALSVPWLTHVPLQSANPGPQEEQQRNPVSGNEKSWANMVDVKSQPRPKE
jgi:hypothetical protein